MCKLSQRGTIQFILFIILLVGIITGAYLVQRTQIFRPRASDFLTPIPSPNHEPDTPEIESDYLPTASELEEFEQWADIHGIILQGTYKPVFFWTALDYEANDENVDLNQIKGLARVYYGLKQLPDDVLEVMRGKTIYFSTTPGRSTTTVSNSKGLNAGIFMAATTTYAQAAVHEFGHIFESYAIGGGEGINNRVQNFPHFNILLSEYRELFPSTEGVYPNIDDSKPIPEGYISYYATTDSTENFTEHFAYYVMEGALFREKAAQDPLLLAKYNFFKDKIFKDKEY